MAAGAAWRIKVTPPADSKSAVVSLPAIALGGQRASAAANAKKMPKSAILQASVDDSAAKKAAAAAAAAAGTAVATAAADEEEDDRPRVKLTLWRREILVGTMELDTNLKVRQS